MTEGGSDPRRGSLGAQGGLTRRSLMARGGAAAVLLGGAGAGASQLLQRPSSALGYGSPGARLRNPSVVRSGKGRLDAKLVCTTSRVDMGASRPVWTYTYNHLVPGPTWIVRPGDVMHVRVINKLPELAGHHEFRNRPHDWTTTNLHTHGLHVSPRRNADNIFLAIPPGERQRYRIAIPEDHPAGIFWYHPHRHGGVNQQVRGGMAGMIIVRGDLDRVPEIKAARERVMVLQAIELGKDYRLQEPIPDPSKEEAFYPRSNVLYTINGQLRPKIRIRPGEVQRWRMLNAAGGKFMSLALRDHDFNVIAWDGMTLPEPDPAEVVMLSAGNRVEVLIKGGRPGTYDLVLTPGSSQRPDIPGMPPSADAANRKEVFCRLDGRGAHGAQAHGAHHAALAEEPNEFEPRTIATVEVVGDRQRGMRVPRDLPAFDQRIRKIRRRTRFEYTVERDPDNEFMDFGIDGKPFDPDRRPYRAKLGTAEEWTIVNGVDRKLPRHAHVFHIHVNPFKITAINGRPVREPMWRDTWVLTGGTGDSFTFETNFLDFTGKFVQHCHVLSHEDLGMMAAVKVVR
jgi:FtsP/CotA-like multicopper oxidase with cupredoxin domain